MTEDLRLHCVEIQRIANLVLGQCDGAKTADGRGFSRGDLTIGRALAVAPIHLWSEKLAGKGAHILWKHRRQTPNETTLLESLCRTLPNPERVDTPVPAIVAKQGDKLIIASEPIGVTEAARKDFTKVITALGFVSKPDGHWVLEREYDLSKLEDPIEKLEKLGWHVLPEATGYLDSYLAHVRLHAAALRKAREDAALAAAEAARLSREQTESMSLNGDLIDRVRAQYNPSLHKALTSTRVTHQRQPIPPAYVRLEKHFSSSGRIEKKLAFKLPLDHPHTEKIHAAYCDRLMPAQGRHSWLILENPTDEDIRLVKEAASQWGLAGGENLSE